MMFQRILTLAQRVILQLATDHRTVALILGAPIVVLTVAGILMRADTTNINIAIVMEDQGSSVPLIAEKVNLGSRLIDALSSVGKPLHIEILDAPTASAKIASGELDAVITLPANFSQNTVQRRELTIPVEYEGSNPMAARLLDGLMSRAAISMLASMSTIATQSAPPVHLQATYRYGNADFDSLDYIAPVFIGLFVFLFVFILTSVAFLRERSSGTLERLQATPIRRIEIAIGYMLGFALFALFQSIIILLFTIYGLKVHYLGSLLLVFMVELLLAIMAVNLGIFLSTFARNEFQVVQFIPLVVVPQILLSGAFWAIEDMPAWLQPLAWLMPLTYANRALRDVMIKGFDLARIWPYVTTLALFAAGFIVLSSLTIRRQSEG